MVALGDVARGARACSVASARSPRSRLTRPSIDRPKASRRGSPTAREASDGALEQGEGPGVVRAVARHRAEVGHRLGPDRRSRLLRRQHLGQRTLGAVVASPQEVDVPHLGPDPGGGLAVAVGDGDPLGLGQGGEPRLVEAAQRVDECLREHQPGLDPVAVGTGCGRPAGRRSRRRRPRPAGRRRTRPRRPPPSPPGSRPPPDPSSRTARGPSRMASRTARSGWGSELAQRDRAVQASYWRCGRLVVAGEPVEPDQQGLVVLVQRAHHGGPDGEVAGPVEVAAGEQPQGGLVQDRLRRGREPAALGQQPGLEAPRRAGSPDRRAGPCPRPGSSTRRVPVAADQHVRRPPWCRRAARS